MVALYDSTTFDVMADLTFGEPLQNLENAESESWMENQKAVFLWLKGDLYGRVF